MSSSQTMWQCVKAYDRLIRYFHLHFFLLPLRLVCSLAALPVQVQVPAWACRWRRHPAGWKSTVRTQERTYSRRPDAKSTPECTPKSRLSRKRLVEHPHDRCFSSTSSHETCMQSSDISRSPDTTQGPRGYSLVSPPPPRSHRTLYTDQADLLASKGKAIYVHNCPFLYVTCLYAWRSSNIMVLWLSAVVMLLPATGVECFDCVFFSRRSHYFEESRQR